MLVGFAAKCVARTGAFQTPTGTLLDTIKTASSTLAFIALCVHGLPLLTPVPVGKKRVATGGVIAVVATLGYALGRFEATFPLEGHGNPTFFNVGAIMLLFPMVLAAFGYEGLLVRPTANSADDNTLYRRIADFVHSAWPLSWLFPPPLEIRDPDSRPTRSPRPDTQQQAAVTPTAPAGMPQPVGRRRAKHARRRGRRYRRR
jgi:hypothetical protein